MRGHSCGGVSSLDNRRAWAPQFSSEGNKGEGAPQFWTLLLLVFDASLVRSLLCIQVPLYFITCCISCFNHII
jgi:hypothetical protein